MDGQRAGRGEGRRGFTLPEMIVGVLLAAIVALLAITIVLAGRRMVPERSVLVGGEVLPIAPSPSAFAAAVGLHGLLIKRLTEARAVYVLGGRHFGIPEDATPRSGAPLAASALPRIQSFHAGLPLDAYAFYRAYSGDLGPTEAGESGDYSVVVIGPTAEGSLELTTLVQVRRKTVALSSMAQAEVFVRRDVRLYDLAEGELRYAYVERPNVAAATQVGASHFWYRFTEGRVAEEGPVVAVFPDPFIYAGAPSASSAQQAEPPAFSRFIHLLCVSP